MAEAKLEPAKQISRNETESGGQELVANRTRVEETNANVLGSHEVQDPISIKAYQ